MMRDIAAELAGDIGQIPTVGVTTGGGTTTTLVDAVIAIPKVDVDFLDGVWVMIDEKVGSGPAVGEIRAITSYAAATGTITVGTAFSAIVETGTDYSLWRHIHPTAAERFLQAALRAQRYKTVAPLSLMPNGDMETTIAAADWTATASGAPTQPGTFVRSGAQELLISPTAADHGVNGVNLRVVGGRNYVLTADVLADVGTGTVRIFDVTASAELSGATVSWAGEAFGEVEIEFQVPTATELIRIDLLGAANLDKIYFDNVNLHRLDQRRIYLPSWVQRPSDVESIGYYERGRPTPTANVYELDEQRFISLWNFEDHVDELLPNTPFSVEISHRPHRPLWIKANRPYTELSTATATTTANREVTVNTALWFLYNHFATTAAAGGHKDSYGVWKDRRRDVGSRNQVASDERATATMEGMSPGLYR